MKGHRGFQMRLSRRVGFLAAFFNLLTVLVSPAQTAEGLTSELRKFENSPGFESDTTYLNKANELGFLLAESNPDSSLVFLNSTILLCREASYKKGEAEALKIYGNALQNTGDFKGSIEHYNTALAIASEIPGEKQVPGILNNIGLVNYYLGNHTQALNNFYDAIKRADLTNNANVKAAAINNVAMIYFEQGKLTEAKEKYRETLAIYQAINNPGRVILAYNNIGDVELRQNNPLEALNTLKIGYRAALELKSPEFIEMTSRTLADIYSALDSLDKAEALFRESISMSRENGYGVPQAHSLIGLADLYYKKGKLAEASGFAKEGLQQAESMAQPMLIRNANELLSRIYEEEGNFAEALQSFKLFKLFNDSINTSQAQRLTASLEAEYEFSKRELEYEKASLRQKWIIFSTIAGLIAFLIILFVGNQNKNRLNKAYHALQEKTAEIEIKNEKLEKALDQLKATQVQLIHAEKMASLGELTAGIAHEIQNPLNFVTNFSELGSDMVQELREERARKPEEQDQSLQDEILADIQVNLDKINHHGKRADSIVKGMLQHSRTSSGEKLPTDINALANEYLRLSFHGLRAKDKTFSADFHTDLDPNLPKAEIVAQDISRVLINLFNNAFYACANAEFRKENPDVKPMVELSTKLVGDTDRRQIQITVSDNGPGIPSAIADKVFQPFFTTKPSGQGTGLGLSLSYDIVKAHGGELKLKSKPGELTTFTIFLPV
ncbi:tetratricopeptide repeat-containing sensor histidine kinase [Algoriphagus terrigena]|uniref:tetratricopeptide repeat-containing sensor histidine kinase n=1 Tax=Algoriphagus terrigena TaxID=344884 RepID=UPI0004122DBE|nr:tetratricopeptide repeat protein [Algoriphagus terrigena]